MTIPAPTKTGRALLGLWVVSTLSSLGDGVTQLVGPLLTATLTHNAVQVGALVIAQQLPWTLFTLPGGALVDRVDRGRLVVVAAVLRAIALAVLGALVATRHVSLALLYGVFFVVGCAGVVSDGATVAVLPLVVAEPDLNRANGRLAAAGMITQVVAAPLGGWLFAVGAEVPFLIDGALFCTVGIAAIALPAPACSFPALSSRETLRSAVLVGLRFISGQPVLRTLAVSVCLTNLALGGVEAELVLVARQRMGPGPVGFDLLAVSLALGGVAGGLMAARLVRALGAGVVLRAGLALELLLNVGLALTSRAALTAVFLAGVGLHGAVFSTVSASQRQTITPPGMLGRVQGAHRLMSRVGVLAGAAGGALMAQCFGPVSSFWLSVAVAALLLPLSWHAFSNLATSTAPASPPRSAAR